MSERKSAAAKVQDKVKQVAQEDFNNASTLANDAVRSGAYLYPFKGIVYFFTHRALWRPLAAKLIPTVSLGLGVTAFMFIVTYVPQAAVLTVFNGPLAFVTTVLLVLSESSTIFNVLSKNFVIDDALIDTFDGTLMSRNMTTLVAKERAVKSGSDPIAKLGKLATKPFAKFAPSAIIRYFMYLPLNFIPIVGTVLFVILQGRKFGPTAHARYFQLKQMNKKEKDQFVERRKAAYASFGVPAVLLEMVPIAGILFSFTNTVGAALWAADMESRDASGQKTTAPGLRNQAAEARNELQNFYPYSRFEGLDAHYQYPWKPPYAPGWLLGWSCVESLSVEDVEDQHGYFDAWYGEVNVAEPHYDNDDT